MSAKPRAYIGIKYHADASNKRLICSLSDALIAIGLEPVCMHRDVERWGEVQLTPKQLMAKTFELIQSCQLVVIELSEKGVGLGIEAGYAFARDIPVVAVARKGADISNTLRGVSKEVSEYGSVDELGDLLAASAHRLGLVNLAE